MTEPRSTDTPYPNVPTRADFPAIERRILDRWERQRTFERSVEQRPADDEYVFYDGPPFANGLPHYGHLLTGYVKDVVPRYQTMRGHRVERRFGWDCHGLPAEMADREGARRLRAGRDHRVRHRPLQRGLPHLGPALHRGVGALRHPPGPLGRLRQRLQDDGPHLHGVRHLGVQAALGQGPDLRGVPGHALLVGRRDPAVELRDPPRRRHPSAPGPGAHRRVHAACHQRRSRRSARGARRRRRRGDLGVDHHAVDPAVEPGPRGRPRRRLRRRGARRGPRAGRRVLIGADAVSKYTAELGDEPNVVARLKGRSSSGAPTSRCSPTSPTTRTASGCSSTTSSTTTTAPAWSTWRRASARTTSGCARPTASCWSARSTTPVASPTRSPTTSA